MTAAAAASSPSACSHDPTDDLDRKLKALIEEQERIEQAGWFS